MMKKFYFLGIIFLSALLSAYVVQAAVKTDNHQKKKTFVVVLDPGHGGKDPGATGPRGTHEKDVVLKIANYLKIDLAKSSPGWKVYLTRTGDYYIPLRERLAIARKYKADVFVSIHADSYRNVEARGASVYALSERGATSESARWLAQRENESEMAGADLSNKSQLLRSVLIDMAQTATINSSLQMGHNLLDELADVTSLHSHKVEQAAFVVLKSPDIPSVLVENGFISNPYEEKNLRTAAYQQALAKAIAQGLIRAFPSS